MELTRIEALQSIIEWDGDASRMLVLNPGDVGEAGPKLSESLCKDKRAKKTKKDIVAFGADVPAADVGEAGTEAGGESEADADAEAPADAEEEAPPA